jgi:DNA replication protein DnaC
LLGATGTGKTSLAVAVLGRVAAELEDGMFLTAPGLVRAVFADMRGRGSRVSERAIETAVLILDDLGSERGSEFAAAEVSAVLCARYDHVRPTIVTSNLSLEDLEPRVASRLACGVVLRLEGQDWRLAKRTEADDES